MQSVLARAGWWLVAVLLAVVAMAGAVDTPFAIQMGIIAAAALVALWFCLRGSD